MTDPWSPSPSQPPPGYAPPQGWQGQVWRADGPVGQQRSTGRCLLLLVVTLSVYTYVYNYKVHREMKEHSGRGVGGGVALLLTFVAGVAMPFVTSAEVGSLYARKGRPEPVRGWTGLWAVLPAVVGYVVLFAVLIAVGVAAGESGEPLGGSGAVALVAAFVGFAAVALAGLVTWFVKTNGALNRYWAAAALS